VRGSFWKDANGISSGHLYNIRKISTELSTKARICDKGRVRPTFKCSLEQALVILVFPVDGNVSGILQDRTCNRIAEKRVFDLYSERRSGLQ
jgi:hypothetical protein